MSAEFIETKGKADCNMNLHCLTRSIPLSSLRCVTWRKRPVTSHSSARPSWPFLQEMTNGFIAVKVNWGVSACQKFQESFTKTYIIYSLVRFSNCRFFACLGSSLGRLMFVDFPYAIF